MEKKKRIMIRKIGLYLPKYKNVLIFICDMCNKKLLTFNS